MKTKTLKNKNTVMLITLGIVAVVLVLLAIIGNMRKGGKGTEPVVEVISVEKGDVRQEIEASGNVESEWKKTFYSPVNATIENMTVEAGDSVEAGQKLIAFNVDNLEADNQKAELTARTGKLELEDAQEQANQAASKVAEAKADIPKLEKQIENKKNKLSDLRQQIAETQKNAQAQVQEEVESAYQAAVLAAETKYQEEMDTYNNVTKPEYDKELEALKQKINEGKGTETDKEDYRHLLDNPPKVPELEDVNPADFQMTGTGMADTSALEAEMENVSSELAALQSELASKEALAQSETTGLTDAAKEKIRISNNLTELETKNLQELLEEGRKGIEAEFSGVISDTKVSQGATVTQGMELFTIQSMEDVCVDASISKYDFDKVKEGQKATVKLGDKKYNGTIEKVNRIAVPNEKGAPTIGVVVHIDNPDDGIFIGVEAKVSIQAAEVKNVPILPVEAVNIGKDGSFCYVVEDGVIKKKEIETGVTSDAFVEIKSGLKDGEQVLTDIGNHSEGDKVKAQEAKTDK